MVNRKKDALANEKALVQSALPKQKENYYRLLLEDFRFFAVFLFAVFLFFLAIVIRILRI